MNHVHVVDEDLESYSMRRLSENSAARVELQLLACEICRQRLAEIEQYAMAMRDGARGLRTQERAHGRRSWSFPWLIPAFATLVLIAIAVVALPLMHRGPAAPFAVALQTMRGPSSQAAGPSRRPLLLELDLSGLAASPSYRIEMVNQAGGRVWQGVFNSRGATASVAVPPQEHGIYFVRVALPSGETVREYGLQLRGTD